MTVNSDMIGRHRPTPLNEQVRDAVAHLIAGGTFAKGGRLPSERQLSERFGVSRVTLRQALQALVDDGMLESSPGRGWYPVESRLEEPPNTLLSFSEMAAARGLRASASVLACATRASTIDEAESLRIAPGASILYLERIRLLDDVAMALQSSIVPLSYAPGLDERVFEADSLYKVLAETYGLLPTRADYSAQAKAADAREAEHLGISAGSPVLICSQTTFDQNGRPIETGEVVYRSDRYRFRTTLWRSPGPLSPTRHGTSGSETGVAPTPTKGER